MLSDRFMIQARAIPDARLVASSATPSIPRFRGVFFPYDGTVGKFGRMLTTESAIDCCSCFITRYHRVDAFAVTIEVGCPEMLCHSGKS